jgi:putative membrane protein
MEMRGVLLRWLVLTAAVLAASWLLEGIRVDGLLSALLAAATLGILNAFLRPLIILLTLPVNILTLGLFTFVINALMLKIVSEVIPGFTVHGFWPAVVGALIIGAVSWFLNAFVGGRGKVQRTSYIDLQKRGGRWE